MNPQSVGGTRGASPLAGAGRRPAEIFRPGAGVPVPGAPDPMVARLAEELGFEAVYVSGSVTSSIALGLPDIGLATLTEMAARAGEIARSVRLPVVADADTGYGNALNVIRAVWEFERAGVAAIHLEDQEFPKRCGHVAGKRVIDAEEMCGKIRAACEARRDPGFWIIARTDARSVLGFDEALRRAKAYREAGADAIFPEALESAEEFERFARALPGVPLIANMTEFGRSPLLPVATLREMGYAAVIYPVTVTRTMLATARALLRDLREEGSQALWLGRMLTRRELYDLNGYGRWVEWDARYVPGGGTPPIP